MQKTVAGWIWMLPILFCFVSGCIEEPVDNKKVKTEALLPQDNFPGAKSNGKFFEKDGRKYLWGGRRESQHFNVNNLKLNSDQFHFGVGREKFQALINPRFVTAAESDFWLPDSARILGLLRDDVVKAYPLRIVNDHEVINDKAGELPILVVYCDLAQLAAIYVRNLNGRVYTFGQAGYTYFDPAVWHGKDGFVLWDRETESLWWPPMGRAVSGPMVGTCMKLLDSEYWCQTTWG